MTFDEDPTNSGTSAIEAFGLKRGVCQDYAHIFIALRTQRRRFPARFVAGHFLRSDGMVNQQAGHAWGGSLRAGSRLDRVRSGQRHLHHRRACPAVAIGLDYLGAAPVRGTRYGGGTETLSVHGQSGSGRTTGAVAEPVVRINTRTPASITNAEPASHRRRELDRPAAWYPSS